MVRPYKPTQSHPHRPPHTSHPSLDRYGKRTKFLEAAYHRALTERQQTTSGAGGQAHKDDLYRAMQRFFLYRDAVSDEVGRTIAAQTLVCRKFYKLIKVPAAVMYEGFHPPSAPSLALSHAPFEHFISPP